MMGKFVAHISISKGVTMPEQIKELAHIQLLLMLL